MRHTVVGGGGQMLKAKQKVLKNVIKILNKFQTNFKQMERFEMS